VPDWRRSYEGHFAMRRDQLRSARAGGETSVRVGMTGHVVRPRDMTDRQIDEVARRDAERVVNRAIIEHNEQAERRS
jgi:hypothetical protein